MNYDKIILELYGRIQELESAVEGIEMRLGILERDDGYHNGTNDKPKISPQDDYSRTKARAEAIDEIMKRYDKQNYFAFPAPRDNGSGIKVDRQDDGDYLIIKFHHSKTSLPRSGKSRNSEIGLHAVDKDELQSGGRYSLYLFSMVDLQGKMHFFMFKPSDLLNYMLKRGIPDDNLFRLQFSISGERKYEVYEKTKKNDVTEKHYNNWDVFGELEGMPYN